MTIKFYFYILIIYSLGDSMVNFISLGEKLSRIYFDKFDKNSEELMAYNRLFSDLDEAMDKSKFKKPYMDFCVKIYGTDYPHMRKKLSSINAKRNLVSKATLNKYSEELNASQYVLQKYIEGFLTRLDQLQDFLSITPIADPAERFRKMWEMRDKKYPLEKMYEIFVRDEKGDVVYENGKPKVRLETEEEVDERINKTLDERKAILEEKSCPNVELRAQAWYVFLKDAKHINALYFALKNLKIMVNDKLKVEEKEAFKNTLFYVQLNDLLGYSGKDAYVYRATSVLEARNILDNGLSLDEEKLNASTSQLSGVEDVLDFDALTGHGQRAVVVIKLPYSQNVIKRIKNEEGAGFSYSNIIIPKENILAYVDKAEERIYYNPHFKEATPHEDLKFAGK